MDLSYCSRNKAHSHTSSSQEMSSNNDETDAMTGHKKVKLINSFCIIFDYYLLYNAIYFAG